MLYKYVLSILLKQSNERKLMKVYRLTRRGAKSGIIYVVLAIIALVLANIAALIQHIVWCFQHAEYVLLLAGVIVAPVGMFHGWGLWFGWWG